MPSPATPPADSRPLPDEPLTVRLLSTIWADAGGAHDDLVTPADVDRWLDAVGFDRAGARAGQADLSTARALRDALRVLAAHITADDRPGAIVARADVATALDQVNATAAEVPVPRLALHAGRIERVAPDGASAVTTALARVAEEAVSLFGGPDAARLRACRAPGCVLYFTKTHPRREWCSVACGNRVRAARHYLRTREPRAES